tara:strand:- start:194 stop:619 length:426 start_codon:yes stop_codon:yes gene_type:complete
MNPKLLSAALALIPNKLQHKAVAKALNYLFSDTSLFEGSRTVNLNVVDLKRQWSLSSHGGVFQPADNTQEKTDVVVKAKLDTIIKAQKQTNLVAALKAGEIVIEASETDKQVMTKALTSISQHKLEALIEHCYAFLRMRRA